MQFTAIETLCSVLVAKGYATMYSWSCSEAPAYGTVSNQKAMPLGFAAALTASSAKQSYAQHLHLVFSDSFS